MQHYPSLTIFDAVVIATGGTATSAAIQLLHADIDNFSWLIDGASGATGCTFTYATSEDGVNFSSYLPAWDAAGLSSEGSFTDARGALNQAISAIVASGGYLSFKCTQATGQNRTVTLKGRLAETLG